MNLFAFLDFRIPAVQKYVFCFLEFLHNSFLPIQGEGSVNVGWLQEKKIVWGGGKFLGPRIKKQGGGGILDM